MEVFLGGTCNDSKWRDELISLLKVDYFNPVVDDWNEESKGVELKKRYECDLCLYTITPKMTGVYSIAELVDDSNKRPEKTIFLLLKKDGEEEFSCGQIKSLEMVANMIIANGGIVFYTIMQVADYINNAREDCNV